MHLRKLIPLVELLGAAGASGASSASGAVRSHGCDRCTGAVRRVRQVHRCACRTACTASPHRCTCRTRAPHQRTCRTRAPHRTCAPVAPSAPVAPAAPTTEGSPFSPQIKSAKVFFYNTVVAQRVSRRRDAGAASHSPSCRTRRCRKRSATSSRAWLEGIAEQVFGRKMTGDHQRRRERRSAAPAATTPASRVQSGREPNEDDLRAEAMSDPTAQALFEIFPGREIQSRRDLTLRAGLAREWPS